MGLYLCRKLCDKMEISMELSSCQGEGTQIAFCFKRADASR
ncbi:MAG: ATP-binding protein [[Clostridium] scindens]